MPLGVTPWSRQNKSSALAGPCLHASVTCPIRPTTFACFPDLQSDLPTSLDGTPYLSLFPTFESLFCAYTRPPSSRPGTAGRGAPVDALRAALQGCLAWVGRELERAARRERSEGAGVQTLPLSWEPSPAELAVLQVSRVAAKSSTVRQASRGAAG